MKRSLKTKEFFIAHQTSDVYLKFVFSTENQPVTIYEYADGKFIRDYVLWVSDARKKWNQLLSADWKSVVDYPVADKSHSRNKVK